MLSPFEDSQSITRSTAASSCHSAFRARRRTGRTSVRPSCSVLHRHSNFSQSANLVRLRVFLQPIQSKKASTRDRDEQGSTTTVRGDSRVLIHKLTRPCDIKGKKKAPSPLDASEPNIERNLAYDRLLSLPLHLSRRSIARRRQIA